MMASRTLAIASRTNSARSYTVERCSVAGVRFFLLNATSFTCRETETMFPPICRVTLTIAAGLPFPVTSVFRSAVPFRPTATSFSRTGFAGSPLMTVSGDVFEVLVIANSSATRNCW